MLSDLDDNKRCTWTCQVLIVSFLLTNTYAHVFANLCLEITRPISTATWPSSKIRSNTMANEKREIRGMEIFTASINTIYISPPYVSCKHNASNWGIRVGVESLPQLEWCVVEFVRDRISNECDCTNSSEMVNSHSCFAAPWLLVCLVLNNLGNL